VETLPEFSESRQQYGQSRVRILRDYKTIGAGVHINKYDIFTREKSQFFAADPLRNAVVVMLEQHNVIDIKEAMAACGEEIMPISSLAIPSTMVFYLLNPFNLLLIFLFCLQMEAELQFQLGRGGNGQRFMPEGAESCLLKGEYEAMPSRCDDLARVKRGRMQNALYFSIQIRTLLPLTIEAVGPFVGQLPTLEIHTCLEFTSDSSEDPSEDLSESSTGSSSMSEPRPPYVEDESDDSGPFVEQSSSPIDSQSGARSFPLRLR
jgi:hypothetical protein